MSVEAPQLFALLVGINEYQNTNVMTTLRGCVNDVDAVEQLLCDRMGVPAENILKLTDAEATHQAIKAAFTNHLIARAKAWAAEGKLGSQPAFLFHYSGHGSQAVDDTGAEPDGMDETIVPHDSRTPGVYDIKDWELGLLLDELTEASQNVTVVLDSCHSGSGTRRPKPELALTRRCPPDMRPQPAHRPARRSTPVRSASGWLPGGAYVLLAGCRDREESHEYALAQGQETRWHGALTYFLVQELSQMQPERRLLYHELYERVRYQVNAIYANQMPQIEGDLGREVFGGVRPLRDVFLSVVKHEDGLVWLDGGLAHGLTEGSLLHVFPPETRLLAEAGPPLSTLQVVQAGVVQSGCLPVEEDVDIPLSAKATIYRLNHGDMRARVALDVAHPATRSALLERLSRLDVVDYVEVVDAGASADYQVEEAGQFLELQDGAGKLVVAPFQLTDLDGLARDLAHLVRYRNALKLRNTAAHSELAGQVSLELKKLSFASDRRAPEVVDLPRSDGGEVIVETGDRLVVEITNHSDLPLYFALLDFTYDWAIHLLYPPLSGAREYLEPGRTFSIGRSLKPREQLQVGLPDADVQEAREYLKVIATVEDTDFEVLRQGALKTPYTSREALGRRSAPVSGLAKLLAQAMKGTRGLYYGPASPSLEDEWTTAELEFLILRPAEQVTKALNGGRVTALPGFPVEIEPPPGFLGSARVLTPRQSVRSAGGVDAGLQPPPGLAGFPDYFRPFDLPAARGAGPSGVVIEVEADTASRQSVTEATPLKVRLGSPLAQDEAGMLALAFDGSFYYPAGRLGEEQNVLHIEWLPDPEPEDVQPLRSTRGLGRTVKLYLYKTASWPEPSLGLHRARFVPLEQVQTAPAEVGERCIRIGGGEVRYRKLQPGDLQPGQKAALFVHGFTSDTQWMVGGPGQLFQENGLHYDHILTFDYETFNTGISENGQALAIALKAAGFGPGDGVALDIFAHSMGNLVTRSMVEMWGGDAFTDRCFLAGPPNLGTRLADLKRFVPWVGAILLNRAAPTPPTLLASWALKKVVADAVGIEDLRPGSDVVQQLNSNPKEARVPYYVLAGSNEIPAEEQGAWKRMSLKLLGGADNLLDFVFGDQNDLVLSVNSMLGVRGGNYPAALLKTRVVPCNHFGYFNTPEAQAQLLAWLKG